MKTFFLIICSLIFVSKISLAQNRPGILTDYDKIMSKEFSDRVGNGGDVVVCNDFKKNKSSIELLDFFELRNIYGYNRKLIINKSLDQNLDLLIGRLGHFDNVMQKKVQAYVENFINEAFFIDNACLVDIADSNHLILPNNCGIFQIAIQSEPDWINKNYRYIIDRTLWDRLDDINRAGLVFHEIVYRVAIENKKIKDSRGTRFLVSLVAADKLKELSPEQYFKFITSEFGIKYSKTKRN